MDQPFGRLFKISLFSSWLMYWMTVFCLSATLGTVLVVSLGRISLYLVTFLFVCLFVFVVAAAVAFVAGGCGGGEWCG